MFNEIKWAKKKGKLQTPWYNKVSNENPLSEYPRPQFVRENWINLNGLWNYYVTTKKGKPIKGFSGKILVPFPIESALSGVEKQLYPNQRLWYKRYFTIPRNWQKNRILLHFGAVDWECLVLINDQKVSNHKGGYIPFTIDITNYVNYNSKNAIQVKVYDPSEKGKQPSGKQWIKPKIVFYTTNSGIWQTVWLESVPQDYISSIKLTPDIDAKNLNLQINLCQDEVKKKDQNEKNYIIKVKVLKKNKTIHEELAKPNVIQKISLPMVNFWTPEKPILYNLEIQLLKNGQIVDNIKSYFAMRKFSLQLDSNGILRFHLNNKPYFMMGLLDQGYWPDGLYVAPTDEALQWDIKLAKEFGFNTIRKHLKVEPARWYYHCDKLGMLVWQDMINGGGKRGIISQALAYFLGFKLKDTRCYWRSGQNKKKDRENFERELKELIDALYNTPSICLWTIFNEAWGQFDSLRISKWLTNYDKTRLVDHASGWFDQNGGHFISIHDYTDKFKMPKEFSKRGVILSETGGYTMKILEHIWNPKKQFGYKKLDTQEELEICYSKLVEKIILPSISKGLSGVIFTQISDVEIEYNGIVTYDRKVKKMNSNVIFNQNKKLFKKENYK